MSSDCPRSMDIDVSIENHKLKSVRFQKKLFFDVRVKLPGKSHVVVRSNGEFKELCYHLKKSLPEFRTFEFPHRSLFKSIKGEDITMKKVEAVSYILEKIASTRDIFLNPLVGQFFQLPNTDTLNNRKHESEVSNRSKAISRVESIDSNDYFNLGDAGDKKLLVEDFTFLKVIGKGSFGRVYLVQYKEEKTYYAMKVLEKKLILERDEIRHIMEERAVLMKNVQCPFLVSMRFAFQTSDKLYFALKYVNGGELFFHLQKEGSFPESRVRFYAAEIGQALGYMHSINIIYRDLKPENILLDNEGHICVTDFGLAKFISQPDQTTTTFCGTPEYLAPEILLKKDYDKTVDWWCYGSVVYEMIAGAPPFYSRNVPQMYDQILNSQLTFDKRFSVACRGFCEALLQKDQTKRLGNGSRDFEEIKEHSFLRRINWDDLVNKLIKPPYTPVVIDELDLRNIDREFVSEEVTESVKVTKPNPFEDQQKSSNPFIGFTYCKKDNILG